MDSEQKSERDLSHSGRATRGPGGMPRALRAGLTTAVLASGLGLMLWLLSFSSPASTRAVARAAAPSCPTRAAAARATLALRAAQSRYRMEARGTVIHADLRRIAGDRRLISALEAGNLPAAQLAAGEQLVNHVVQIRVLRGARVLLDANPTSFDVAGSTIGLRGANGRALGTLQITVQDVIGFNKLVHKLAGADVLVRGAAGQMRTSLPLAAAASLPSSGCSQLGARRYVVSSFQETSYTGEALTIWVLTAP